MVAGLAAALLSACSQPAVDIDPPDPAAAALEACTALAVALPDRVEDQDRRDTEPESAFTAAWGDSPITLRCGVPEPDALGPASELTTVDDVDWFPQELTAGYRFTTTGRVARVEVEVPDDYTPEVNPLVDLASAIVANVPLED